ncbi:hypothetical protein [Microbacterium radiodurans]|uniref:SRPBCC family protein n=1 Tax=Microbacterium radiodurans TaxID=661398 RepID=A0A5J5ISQ1_9MICO|nr:hypothetical protein [Microbacterium radiodurans]KAA9089017.1 hypothetical protein F6B42_00455 [Microbacterium radiodurans]
MRILQKLVLDCDADAAWRALHSPRALAELYAPVMGLEPLAAEGMPTSLEPGADVPVQMSAFGMPVGRQLIHVSDRRVTERIAAAETGNGSDGGESTVRILRDSGIPLTGPLAMLDVWDHQMAVSPAPGDPTRTLWRERLVIGGAAAPALWPVLWATWQWRSMRLRQVAPTWAHDPAEDAPTA